MSDSDWEVVDEELYHLEVNECPTKLRDASKLRIAGLNKNNPILQVDNLFFQGSYEHEVGTTMFFDGNMKNADMMGVLVEKTEKKLTMNEVHMSRKRRTTQSDQETSSSSGDDEDDQDQNEPKDNETTYQQILESIEISSDSDVDKNSKDD